MTEPGVYFGMPDEEYHAIEALSASGIKNLRISPLDYWARTPWLNPNYEDDNEDGGDSYARILGRAYHKRILEGRGAFETCYAPTIDKADYPDALVNADAVKAELRKHKAEGAEVKLGGTKDDLIGRLLELNPKAQVWDVIEQGYIGQHEGKTLLPHKVLDKIELAAAMIERHPHLCKAFTGGAAEVSIVWDCPKHGIRCKSRLDYLKRRAICDLKTFANPQGKPIPIALNRELAFRKYHIQAAMYAEAAAQVAGFIKAGAVHGDADAKLLDALAANEDKQFLFVFQAKGPAPMAIGRTLNSATMVFQIGATEVDYAKEAYRKNFDQFGTDPWLDITEIEAFADEEIPSYGLE